MRATRHCSWLVRYVSSWSSVRRYKSLLVKFHPSLRTFCSCQWIDVSTYNTSVTTHTDQLISRLNPYNFLCEGIADNRTWLATNFTTMCCGGSGCCGDTPMTNCCGGLPVSKQACQHWDEAEEDNLSKLIVTIPLDGEGQVTADCGSSTGHWGEKRDCGFRLHPKGKMLSCGTAGKNTTLHNLTSTKKLQVFIFRFSFVLMVYLSFD